MAATCPNCGSTKLRSGKLHSYNGLIRMVFYTPLRCRDCHHRFWQFNLLKPVAMLAVFAGLVGVTFWFTNPGHGFRPTIQASTALPHERAAKGDADAQLALGMRYAEGDGVVKNHTEAAKWFALAAKQGSAEAQYQYGLALLQGRGVVQDYRAAFDWIEKPAKRGYAKAQYSLGELYRYGTGTTLDKGRAYLWFNLAAAQGVDAAAKARDSLVWQLKPEQITAMQEEARRISRAPPTAAEAPAPAKPATAPTPP